MRKAGILCCNSFRFLKPSLMQFRRWSERTTSLSGRSMGGCSVREFKARWVRELEAHGVPEPELSVKYIIEHVLQNRKQEDVRFKQ